MNGKMVVSKPLYVTLAQRKEDRRARLQVWLVLIADLFSTFLCWWNYELTMLD